MERNLLEAEAHVVLEVFMVAVRRQLPLPAVEVEVAVREISTLHSGVPVMAMLEVMKSSG